MNDVNLKYVALRTVKGSMKPGDFTIETGNIPGSLTLIHTVWKYKYKMKIGSAKILYSSDCVFSLMYPVL